MKLQTLFFKTVNDYYFEDNKIYLLLEDSYYSIQIEDKIIIEKNIDIIGKEIEDIEIISELGNYFLLMRFTPKVLTCNTCLFCSQKREYTKTEGNEVKIRLF